jgi:hypothetical protein
MIVLFACFLDYAWCRSADDWRRIDREYFGAKDPPPLPRHARLVAAPADGMRNRWSRLRRLVGFPARCVAVRVHQAVAFFQELRQCDDLALAAGRRAIRRQHRRCAAVARIRKRLRNWPRFGRMVFWWFVAVMLLGFSNHLAGTAIVEVPARGIGDRASVWLHPCPQQRRLW